MVMTIDDLSLRVRRAQSDLDRRTGEYESLASLLLATEAEVASLKSEITELDKVATFLTSIGEERQFKAQSSIEALVTEGLQTIFDDSLSFHILQKVNGKSATIEFVVRTALPNSQIVETSVLDARGGGLSAVVGFLLRLVVLLLRRDGSRNLLVLDETFAHVSSEYLPPLSDFLSQLIKTTGVQIIMVTHQPEFGDYADKVYRFTMSNNGNTLVKVEK